jgi:hypothetical protein
MTCQMKVADCSQVSKKTHKRNVRTMENWLKLSLVVRKFTASL